MNTFSFHKMKEMKRRISEEKQKAKEGEKKRQETKERKIFKICILPQRHDYSFLGQIVIPVPKILLFHHGFQRILYAALLV